MDERSLLLKFFIYADQHGRRLCAGSRAVRAKGGIGQSLCHADLISNRNISPLVRYICKRQAVFLFGIHRTGFQPQCPHQQLRHFSAGSRAVRAEGFGFFNHIMGCRTGDRITVLRRKLLRQSHRRRNIRVSFLHRRSLPSQHAGQHNKKLCAGHGV